MSNVPIPTEGFDWKSLLDSAAEAGGFEAIPAQQYDAQIISAKAQLTKAGDKSMIVAVFRIIGGPYNGRQVWNNFVLTTDKPQAMRFFFLHMGALGLKSDFFATSPSLETVALNIVGKMCRIDVSVGSYNGAPNNQVDRVHPANPGVTPPPITSSVGPVNIPQPAAAVPTPPAEPVNVPQPPAPTPEPAADPLASLTDEQKNELLRQALAQQAAADQPASAPDPAPPLTNAEDEPPKPPF